MLYKKLFITVLLAFITLAGYSQGFSINTDGSDADSSAMLDVKSTNKGVLLPRMTDAQRDAIVSPKEGLLIFNTTTKNVNVYKSGAWYEFSATCVSLPTPSNAGTNQTLHGTTATLAANAPISGTGIWSITSGSGGSVDSPSSPTSNFTGSTGSTYVLTWTISTACSSSNSTVSITFVSPCSDGLMNGAETDVDCGGGTCSPCGIGLNCGTNSDCASTLCNVISHICVSSYCNDGVKDGFESDVDCGGNGFNTCLRCSAGLHCYNNFDCISDACLASLVYGQLGICITDQCSDRSQDGDESDVDCGGVNACSRCNVGQKCGQNWDCASNNCSPTFHCQ